MWPSSMLNDSPSSATMPPKRTVTSSTSSSVTSTSSSPPGLSVAHRSRSPTRPSTLPVDIVARRSRGGTLAARRDGRHSCHHAPRTPFRPSRWPAGARAPTPRPTAADLLDDVPRRRLLPPRRSRRRADEFFAALLRSARAVLRAARRAPRRSSTSVSSPHFRGWERVGAELTNNRVDYREQLDVSTEHPPYPADVEPAYLRLDGPNQWLPEHVLPGLPRRRRRVLRPHGRRRLGADGGHVGRPRPAPASPARPVRRAPAVVRQAHPLPAHPGRRGGRQRAPRRRLPHAAAAAPRRRPARRSAPTASGSPVEPPPGAIIVNIGEMLQAMTGNYFVACTHRVIATEPRFSSAYFHGPDLRTPLEPLPLAVAVRRRRWPPARVIATPGFMAKRDELLDGARRHRRAERAGVRPADVELLRAQLPRRGRRALPRLGVILVRLRRRRDRRVDDALCPHVAREVRRHPVHHVAHRELSLRLRKADRTAGARMTVRTLTGERR